MNFLEIHETQEQGQRAHRRIAPWLLTLGVLFGLWLQFQPRLAFEHRGEAGVPSLVLSYAAPVDAGGDVTIAPPNHANMPIEPPPPSPPELVGLSFDTAQLSAHGALVRDVQSGAILFEKEGSTPRPIASITKLMSALVILEKQPNWNATTTVIGADTLDTHMYAGDIYGLSELWQAALVASSNKAIITLAHALDWPVEAFVERMNQRAIELGLTSAIFRDPTGLDEGNVASPQDVARLLERASASSEIRERLVQKEVTLFSKERRKSHHMWNTNWLLLGWIPHTFEGELLGKTGYTTAAGYNFAVLVSDGSDHMIEVVILGAVTHEARFTEAKALAEWALKNYVWKEKVTSNG